MIEHGPRKDPLADTWTICPKCPLQNRDTDHHYIIDPSRTPCPQKVQAICTEPDGSTQRQFAARRHRTIIAAINGKQPDRAY